MTRSEVMEALLGRIAKDVFEPARAEMLARAYEALHRCDVAERYSFARPAGLDSGAALRDS